MKNILLAAAFCALTLTAHAETPIALSDRLALTIKSDCQSLGDAAQSEFVERTVREATSERLHDSLLEDASAECRTQAKSFYFGRRYVGRVLPSQLADAELNMAAHCFSLAVTPAEVLADAWNTGQFFSKPVTKQTIAECLERTPQTDVWNAGPAALRTYTCVARSR